MPLHIIDHPLARILITQLRNKETASDAFRTASRRITQILVIEASKSLNTEIKTVSTPIEDTEGYTLADKLTIVPIIRAGISMVEPTLDFLPQAVVGYIGLERDEKTAVSRSYYRKVPSLKGRKAFIVDPMLVTGGSTLKAIDVCTEEGATEITVISIISAPEGIKAVEMKYPHIHIYTASLDRELNRKKYILPGLGDFGDRLYNT
jgi:uracil phosphoribosyltransferase